MYFSEMVVNIRHAVMEDLEAIAELEEVCFPIAEAAKKEDFADRLRVYPEYFWLLGIEDDIISMVNGMVTNSSILQDEMYHNSSLHDEKGMWQMIFGVETRPEYRGKGYAGQLLHQVIVDAKSQGRKGVVLTCKEKMIPYYEKFGFIKEGLSESTHGGQDWYQMKIVFDKS